MNEKNEFKPYIPADRVMPELTVTSIVMGMLLAVIFGAANAYLGLRVGMTVSASIPAAVISMGVIRVIMKRNSILESNMVQTIGSAGESLAAGAIFTMPALFLWAEEGLCDMPSLVEITLIALCGGVLGVLFMVPLRNALIVKEHETLLYPEGTACADVLLAGEEGGANASTVFAGLGIAAAFKFVIDGLKLVYENGLLTLDCSQCGAGRTQRHVELDKLDSLELYLDVSSVEIFINDGDVSLTSRCFFDGSVRNVAASCDFTLYQAPRIEIESRDSE